MVTDRSFCLFGRVKAAPTNNSQTTKKKRSPPPADDKDSRFEVVKLDVVPFSRCSRRHCTFNRRSQSAGGNDAARSKYVCLPATKSSFKYLVPGGPCLWYGVWQIVQGLHTRALMSGPASVTHSGKGPQSFFRLRRFRKKVL